jgi:hypothetical protein
MTRRTRHRIRSTVFSQDIDDVDDVPDLLGREHIVAEIVRELRTDKPPQIIGVYGWWGSGKTYLLSQVIRRLLDSNKQDAKGKQIIVCTFKAWHYEMEQNLAGGLVRAFVDIEKHNPGLKPPEGKIPAYVKPAARLLNQISKVATSLGPVGLVLGPTGQAFAEHVLESIEDNEITPSTVDTIQDTMWELVDGILSHAEEQSPEKKDYRVVMFIDDLDRCSPQNMVQMFEWLKVHLRVENCIYVIGLDNTAAARAIVGKYREYLDETEGVSYGFRYLEKLVESEYELGVAPNAEVMAVRKYFEGEPCYAERAGLSDISHQMRGGFFRGEDRMKELLQMRALHPPRTMLKIVYKWKRAMNALESEDAAGLRRDLTESYPFWTLLLIAIYYSLQPDFLADFIREKGIIYELMRKPGSGGTASWGRPPLYEFCEFANSFTSNIPIPQSGALRELAATILGNSPASSSGA